MRFDEWLSSALEDASRSGKTLRKIAADAGIKPSYLSALKSGQKTNPSSDVLQRIARALDLPTSEVFEAVGRREERVIICCWHKESQVAELLKLAIEQTTPGLLVSIVQEPRLDQDPYAFVSDLSEHGHASQLCDTLTAAKLLVVLLSPESAEKTWLSILPVALSFHRIPIVVLAHRDLKVIQLAAPFSSATWRRFDVTDSAQFVRFLSVVPELLGKDKQPHPEVSQAQIGPLAREITERGRIISRELRHLDDSHSVPNVCFNLYSKSSRQLIQNKDEAGDNALFFFRKRDLISRFDALLETGQPMPLIQSLDEYWISLLVERHRLMELTDLVSFSDYFPRLLDSCIVGGKLWAVPHFLDFSFYSLRGDAYSATEPILAHLSKHKALSEQHLAQLRKMTHDGNVLVYDFHTPDTVAAVMFEFFCAFGGWSHKALPPTVEEPESLNQDIRALTLLRALVGERPAWDFEYNDPLDLDSAFGDCVLMRHWNAMTVDEQKCFDNSNEAKQRALSFDEPWNPFLGTVGGWYLGVIDTAPSMQLLPTSSDERKRQIEGWRMRARRGLEQLVNVPNQIARMNNCAGLPVMRSFYMDSIESTRVDRINQWRLEDIGSWISDGKLRKRSAIPGWHKYVDRLWSLHQRIMRCNPADIGREYRLWIKQISNT